MIELLNILYYYSKINCEEVINLGVIYIGDRETGKTHLAMELGNPNYHYVKVTYPDYNTLKAKVLYDEVNQKTQPTEANQPIYNEHLEIEVELPVGKKEIFLD